MNQRTLAHSAILLVKSIIALFAVFLPTGEQATLAQSKYSAE